MVTPIVFLFFLGAVLAGEHSFSLLHPLVGGVQPFSYSALYTGPASYSNAIYSSGPISQYVGGPAISGHGYGAVEQAVAVPVSNLGPVTFAAPERVEHVGVAAAAPVVVPAKVSAPKGNIGPVMGAVVIRGPSGVVSTPPIAAPHW